MQTTSSTIRTRVSVFISNDDNHYTTGTFMYVYMYDCHFAHIYICVHKSISVSIYLSIYVSIYLSINQINR